MTLYEIDSMIEQVIDQDTGEILDIDALEALSIERDKKIENIALFVKNLSAESKAIEEEERKLRQRRTSCDRKIEQLKSYLMYALAGQKFKTARCSVSYRHSQKCVPSDGFVDWALNNDRDDLLRIPPPEPNLTAIKKAIEDGNHDIPAEMVENVTLGVR